MSGSSSIELSTLTMQTGPLQTADRLLIERIVAGQPVGLVFDPTVALLPSSGGLLTGALNQQASITPVALVNVGFDTNVGLNFGNLLVNNINAGATIATQFQGNVYLGHASVTQLTAGQVLTGAGHIVGGIHWAQIAGQTPLSIGGETKTDIYATGNTALHVLGMDNLNQIIAGATCSILFGRNVALNNVGAHVPLLIAYPVTMNNTPSAGVAIDFLAGLWFQEPASIPGTIGTFAIIWQQNWSAVSGYSNIATKYLILNQDPTFAISHAGNLTVSGTTSAATINAAAISSVLGTVTLTGSEGSTAPFSGFFHSSFFNGATVNPKVNYNSMTVSDELAVGGGAGNASVLSAVLATGNGISGNRAAINGTMMIYHTTIPSGSSASYSGTVGFSSTAVSIGGTVSGTYATYLGGLNGINGNVILYTGATGWSVLSASEFDVCAQTGTSVGLKTALFCVLTTGDAVQGAFDDAAMIICADAAPSAWKKGIQFGLSYAPFPFNTSSTLIGAQAQTLGTIAPITANFGVDFSLVTFTTAAFKSPGFFVDPSGNISLFNSFSTSAGTGIFAFHGTTPEIFVGQNGSTAALVLLNAAAATVKTFGFATAGLTRWQLQTLGNAETGSNAGSDFAIQAFNDAGTLISTPLSIVRATGIVSLGVAGATGAAVYMLGALSNQSTQIVSAASGGSYTVPNNCDHVILFPVATIASYTVTMPAVPVPFQEIVIATDFTITAFTLAGNTGQAVLGAPTTLAANTSVRYLWVAAASIWVRLQ